MTEEGKELEVIMVPDNENDGDDWPNAGPQNLAEAQAYTDKIIQIFKMFDDLIHDDNKDALPKDNTKFKEVDGQTLGLHGASRPRGCDLVNY